MDKIKSNITTNYNKYAKDYAEKFMKMNLYDDTYDYLCSISKKDSKVLEIASGPGNVSKYLLSKRTDLIITGIDISSKMVEIAKKNNPTVSYFTMDCKDIRKLNQLYDVIICAFCIPYLSKEEVTELISNSVDMLEKNGLFYISAMIDSYTRSGYEKTSFTGDDELYIYYHEEDYLKNIFEVTNLEVEKIFDAQYPESDGTFTNEKIIICRKKEAC